MIKPSQVLALMGAVVLLTSAGGRLVAQQQQQPPPDRQGRGNFDPEQMRQRMMERYREGLEIKGDDEWKIVQARIEKVNEARRDVGFGGMGRMGFGRPPGGGGGAPGDQAQGDRRAARGGFGAQANPEAEALQKAIDSQASKDELKAALGKYREARKAKEAALEKAQDELRQVLTVRQEALAVLMGLLN
jgi:hypothetical protein